jgi:transposase
MEGCRQEPGGVTLTLVKLLRAGQSIRNAAKIAGKGVSTVQRVKAALDREA